MQRQLLSLLKGHCFLLSQIRLVPHYRQLDVLRCMLLQLLDPVALQTIEALLICRVKHQYSSICISVVHLCQGFELVLA
jgi:hypothetical protein